MNRYLYAICTVLMAMTACRPLDNLEEVQFVTDPEFTVDLFDWRDPATGNPRFGLYVESRANYPCDNTRLTTQLTALGNAIELEFLGVSQTEPCDSAPAPIRQFIELGSLSDGEYEFSLRLNDVAVSKGVLTVSSGLFSLSAVESRGVDFRERVLQRIPEGIIWGFIRIPDEKANAAADQFLQILKPLSAEADLPPAYYGYFSVAGTGVSSSAAFLQLNPSDRFFIRRFNKVNFPALRAMADNFRAQPGAPDIRCFSTAGEW